MAKYQDAINWIAENDGAADTQGLEYLDALDNVAYLVTSCLVADIFGVDNSKVGQDILKARGFKKPKGI